MANSWEALERIALHDQHGPNAVHLTRAGPVRVWDRAGRGFPCRR